MTKKIKELQERLDIRNKIRDINDGNKEFWIKTSKQFSDDANKYPQAVVQAVDDMKGDFEIGRESISLEVLTSKNVQMILRQKSYDGKKGGAPQLIAKPLIKAEWLEWQKNPKARFNGRATEFSRAMQTKYSQPTEIDERTITDWCTAWKKLGIAHKK